MPLWYFSGFIVLNSLLIVYFFLPSVRAGYLNSRLRWWESKPRYLYPLPVEIKSKEKIFSGKILNISEGGIYFETPGVFAMGDQPEFNFNILNNPISIAGKVVHCRIQGSQNQFGIQFVADRKTLQTIKKIVRLLRALNVSRTREAEDRDYLNEMTTVMKDIVMNGKGLTPQIPNYRNKTSKTG
jgi:Tfp pilus assembly protein PilZ